MTVTCTTNEFIIPRGSVVKDCWLYKDGKLSLLGYILHNYFNVPIEKLDGEVYINNLSNRTGESYEGFTRYNEKDNKNEVQAWVNLYMRCESIDSQMMCISQYSDYKCGWLKTETNIEL